MNPAAESAIKRARKEDQMSTIRVGDEDFVPADVVKQEDGSVALRVGCQDVVVSQGALKELNAAKVAPMKLWLVMLCGSDPDDSFMSSYVEELSSVVERSTSDVLRCGAGGWDAKMLRDPDYRAVIVLSATKPTKNPLRMES